MPRNLHANAESAKYKRWREEVEPAITKGNNIKVGEFPVILMQSGTTKALCIHKEALTTLAKLLGITLHDNLPDKTSEYLSIKEDIPRILRTSRDNPTYKSWREKTEAALGAGDKIEIGGYSVIRMAGTHKPLCLHKDALPELAKLLGITLHSELPDKTEEFLTLGRELPKRLGTTPTSSKYSKWYSSTLEAFKQGENIEIGGFSVRLMQSGPTKALCLHESALPALAKKLDITLLEKVSDKTAAYLTIADELPKRLGTTSVNLKYKAWMEEVREKINKGEKVEIAGHPVTHMKSGARSTLCLHEEAAPTLATMIGIAQYGKLPEKTEEFLTLGTELPKRLGTFSESPIFKKWRQGVEAKFVEGGEYAIDGFPVVRMQSRQARPLCINQDAVGAIKAEIDRMEQGTIGVHKHSNKVTSNTLKPDSIKKQKAERGGWARSDKS